jgi:GT2 family glycosyltransferase
MDNSVGIESTHGMTHNNLKVDEMPQPKVVIIIVNWNGWPDTIECLESLFQITYENYDVLVADNGSNDNSIEKIKEYCSGKNHVKPHFFTYWPDNKPIVPKEYSKTNLDAVKSGDDEVRNPPASKTLTLIKNEKNIGFAEANNEGIKYALIAQDPDYFLLLNNDTVVDREFLTELVKVAESNRSIGIVGPKTYYYSQPTKFQSTWNTLNLFGEVIRNKGAGQIDVGQFNANHQTGYVFGSCFLIKREVVDRVGLLDRRFFSYWEDADYCVRASRLNFKNCYCWKAKIWHKISRSAKKGGLSDYYGIRNKFWFIKKHATKVQYGSFLLFFATYGFWFISARLLVMQKNVKSFYCFLKGIHHGILKDLNAQKNL